MPAILTSAKTTMKTNLDLPPELLRSADRLIAAEGIALRDLVVRLLRRHLKNTPLPPPRPQPPESEGLDWREELL